MVLSAPLSDESHKVKDLSGALQTPSKTSVLGGGAESSFVGLNGPLWAALGPRAICELAGESLSRCKVCRSPPNALFNGLALLLIQTLLAGSAPPAPAPPQNVGLALLLQ